jgi:pyruvate/2-oxoglutarate dehydrogenase complex dihydrolipoamide acyltransferase (E2) component
VAALKKFPEFNAASTARKLVLKQLLPHRLRRRHAQRAGGAGDQGRRQEGHLQISQEMGELAKKARDGKLSPADMSGGCFTISSLGGIGGRYFTPIINAPEVAIMGVCRSNMEPVWDGKAFQPRLMLPLSLSWDHRVIDGAAAARFNAYFASAAGDFRRIAAVSGGIGRWHDRSEGARHRRLQGCRRDRAAGQARRHGEGRAEPDHGGVDKASMEIPSSHAGVVKELKVKLGDKVNEGSVILVLEAEGAAAACRRRSRLRRLRLLPAAPARRHGAGIRTRRRTGPGRRHASAAAPTSSATCWCSAPARAATRPPSAPPTSA